MTFVIENLKYLISKKLKVESSPKCNQMMSFRFYRPYNNLSQMESVLLELSHYQGEMVMAVVVMVSADTTAAYAGNQSIFPTLWRGETKTV